MAESSGNFEVVGHFVQPDEEAGWTRTSDDKAVPTGFRARLFIADPPVQLDLYVVVDGAGRAQVRQFGVTSDDQNTAVTTRLLRRLPVDALLREVLGRAAVKARPRPDVAPKAFQIEGDPDHQAWVSGGPPPEARGKTSEDRVARAAQIYKQALASGSRAPGEVVAETLGYSRATAARDIRAARERKLLPPLGQDAVAAPGPGSAITGTGRVTRMPWSDYIKAAEDLGLRGPKADAGDKPTEHPSDS